MRNNEGFTELKTVNDYWKKLEFEFNNLKNNNDNTYIAFNFFVTAYHLIDWIFKGKYSKERTELNKEPIIKVCSHIANGIKHFEADIKRHNSIKEIEKKRFIEKGFIEDGFIESPIIIHFDDNLKSDFGNSLKIIELASQVMKFWKIELTKRKLID